MTTPAQLSAQIVDLLTRWNAQQDQLDDWLTGSPAGGPNGDGRYPLTNAEGSTQLFLSLPSVINQVSGPAASAASARDAAELAASLAQAAQAAAESAVTAAQTAQSLTTTAKNTVDTQQLDVAAKWSDVGFWHDSISAGLPSKLDRAGGVMTGPITLPNNATGLIFGDDVMLGDFNAADTLFVTGILNPDRGYVNFGPGGNTLGCIAGQPLTFRSQAVTLADHLHSALDAPFIRTTSSADQPLPSGQLTILDYDTTTTNNAPSVFSVSTDGRITVAVAGVYTISTGVVVEAPEVDTLSSASLGLFVNGNLVAVDTNETTLGVSASRGQSISTQIALSAGDIVDARVTATSVGGVSNGRARRLGLLLGQNATQVNHLSIVKCTAVGPQIPS